MSRNPFKEIMANEDLKSVMIYGMSPILESIYGPLGRFRTKDTPIIKNGKEIWIKGVYDYNTKTGEYDIWSGINFFNTNYTMCEYALKNLKENGVEINFSENQHNLVNIRKIKNFLSELEKRKYEFFYDGFIKDELNKIHDGTWSRGEEHTNNIKKNYKQYWPESINYIDDDGEKGMTKDMVGGIDGTLIFNGKDDETLQVKGCIKVTYENGKYHVNCVVDYSKYQNINYFCFFPSNENKIYIFKNDKNLIENYVDNNGNPIFLIDEKLKYYENEK